MSSLSELNSVLNHARKNLGTAQWLVEHGKWQLEGNDIIDILCDVLTTQQEVLEMMELALETIFKDRGAE